MTTVKKLVPASLLAGTIASLLVLSARAQSTQPAETEKPTRSAIKLHKPYSQIKSLDNDQKSKISDIHATALKAIRRIHEQEEDDIRAVLSDAQKVELQTMEEDAAAKRKEKAGMTKDKKDKADTGDKPDTADKSDKADKGGM